MEFNGFKKEAIEFLNELEKNNNKTWFENNKYLWEKYILNVNKAFVDEMGETLQILVPTINAIPKISKSLFKLYRDTRFSKDKTPFKDKVGIIFWQGTTHRMDSSSYYFFYKKDVYFIGAGMRDFKPHLLKAYRKYIKNENKAKELEKILETLKQKGFEICEPQYKRLPRDFNKDYKYPALALYGTLYAHKIFDIDDRFFSFEIVDYAFKHYEELKELQIWLYELSLFAKDSKTN